MRFRIQTPFLEAVTHPIKITATAIFIGPVVEVLSHLPLREQAAHFHRCHRLAWCVVGFFFFYFSDTIINVTAVFTRVSINY